MKYTHFYLFDNFWLVYAAFVRSNYDDLILSCKMHNGRTKDKIIKFMAETLLLTSTPPQTWFPTIPSDSATATDERIYYTYV